MKRSLALLMVLLLILTGCKSSPASEQSSDHNESHLVSSPAFEHSSLYPINSFAVKLLQQTHCNQGTLISPVSILYSLGMAANGADGETLSEICKVLSLNTDELNEHLIDFKNSKSKAFNFYNSIWANKNKLELKEKYLKNIENAYSPENYSVDFSEDIEKQINDWVSEKTNGDINQILGKADEDALLYFVNAVNFCDVWQSQYHTASTKQGDFVKENGDIVSLPMMTKNENFYIEDEDAYGFIKPYSHENFSFVAILPKNDNISDYIKKLTGEALCNLVANKQKALVRTTVPKFSAESDFDITEILKSAGIISAFDKNKANFRVLSDTDTYTNRILHKTKFEINENGTKASAATIVENNLQSAVVGEPKDVHLTKPFVYMIFDHNTNIPVFIGSYTGNEKVMFTCGNTITKMTVDGKTYEFEGGNSVWLSQLLANLKYHPDKLCKCLPEIQVDTEHKTGYGISLGENPYARCDEGQADLTKEQAERIQQIIGDVKSGKLFGE